MNGLNREQVDILERDLKGLKVKYELLNGSKRQYKYNGLVEAASSQKIPDLNQTVEIFFQVTHKVKLSHPGLPCLWRSNIGQPAENKNGNCRRDGR